MIDEIRKYINAQFRTEKYERLLGILEANLGEAVDFRVAESPVFIPATLRDKLSAACDDICQQLLTDVYFEKSKAAIPAHQFVPGQEGRPSFIIADFAICKDEQHQLYPQLIELQGFPSLFCYQTILAEAYKSCYEIPENYGPYLNGYQRDSFINMLKKLVLGAHVAENVILLELEPHKQKTRADFFATKQLLGIESVCLSQLIRKDRKLFYLRNGVEVAVHRIYNRVIFDELEQRPELIGDFNLKEEVDVEWVCHPNWYFRLSKFSLPFLKSVYVPKSYFANELAEVPADLASWVLKPLYSFAGSGVLVDLEPTDLARLENAQHYLLQHKVDYDPVLKSPEAAVKIEVRMMLFWPDDSDKPQLITNLARLSRGKLIGVRYNKDFNWVGGSSAFFEH